MNRLGDLVDRLNGLEVAVDVEHDVGQRRGQFGVVDVAVGAEDVSGALTDGAEQLKRFGVYLGLEQRRLPLGHVLSAKVQRVVKHGANGIPQLGRRTQP